MTFVYFFFSASAADGRPLSDLKMDAQHLKKKLIFAILMVVRRGAEAVTIKFRKLLRLSLICDMAY